MYRENIHNTTVRKNDIKNFSGVFLDRTINKQQDICIAKKAKHPFFSLVIFSSFL